jgi:hypothetical protein
MDTLVWLDFQSGARMRSNRNAQPLVARRRCRDAIGRCGDAFEMDGGPGSFHANGHVDCRNGPGAIWKSVE